MENPYQAPTASLQEPRLEQSTPFYVVAERKFLALFLATIGLYQIYWFYRHWKAQNAIAPRYWPIPRAIFSIFFVHSLFREVRRVQEEGGRSKGFDPDFLATSFVVVSLASVILNRLAYREIGAPLIEIIGLLVFLPLTTWVLYRAQRAINLACKDPEGRTNANFSGANIVWLLLGGVFWLLTLAGWVTMITEG